MKKSIRPVRARDATPLPYPTLRSEWERRGATRRGFLGAALAGAAGGAGAMTGCMGAPPRPSYPQPRLQAITIRFDRPVTFSGCGDAVAQQGFVAIEVTTQVAALANRLRSDAAQTQVRQRIKKALSPAICQHSTLTSFRARVEQVLRDEVLRWYRTDSGVTLQADSLRVELRTAVQNPPSKKVATD